MKTFYAKPYEIYDLHIFSVYNSWKENIETYRPIIDILSKKYGFSFEDFRFASLLSVVFHDIGKVNNTFQRAMINKRNNKEIDYENYYRHEMLSFPWICNLACEKLGKDRIAFESLAVLGHHRAIDLDLSKYQRERRNGDPAIDPDGIAQALLIADQIMAREGYNLDLCRHKWPEIKEYYANSQAYLQYVDFVIRHSDPPQKEAARMIYALYKGFLHACDWEGSAHEIVPHKLHLEEINLKEKTAKRAIRFGRTFHDWTPFQKMLAQTYGDVIAIAPTGSGKTEASLLWALNNLTNNNKIIYLLPTMATTNSIYERCCDFFGAKNVGVAHSAATLVRKNENHELTVTADRAFMRPITVATVDQLLTTGFNGPMWTIRELAAVNSLIIIDEIHAYDAWTLGLIVAMIRHFRQFGAKFLLMSATMPKSLVSLLQSELENGILVIDQELLVKKRSYYRVFNKTLDQDLYRIKQAIGRKNKVLIVVNTIARCQQLASIFSKYNPVCFHSMFMNGQKALLAKQIENGEVNLVIATQVVEVSLDINFDWMFTECAPADALVQRAGRINRYRTLPNSKFYIYKPFKESYHIYDQYILDRTFNAFQDNQRALSEEELSNIVDEVYEGNDFTSDVNYQSGLNQYYISQNYRSFIFDNPRIEGNEVLENEQTRLTTYRKVNVILDCFYNEIKDLPPKERMNYEVKVPLWYWLKNKVEHDDFDHTWFVNAIYDTKLGVILQNNLET